MSQLTFEAATLLEDIQQRGYAELEHKIENWEVESLIEAYTDFTVNLPDPDLETVNAMLPDRPLRSDKISERNFADGRFSYAKWIGNSLDNLIYKSDSDTDWHKYRTNVPGVGKPDGYTNRTIQKAALQLFRGVHLDDEDPKEYYHYTPSHYQNMTAQNRALGRTENTPPEVGVLDQRFTVIHSRSVELITRICAQIEEIHPEINSFITPETLSRSPNRLLFYHPSDKPQLAGAHYDKGALTLQLAESHQGLRIAPNKESDLEAVVRDASKAAFFPGRGVRDYVAEDTPYQPGWHDVVETGVLNPGRFVPEKAARVCTRWALIFFAGGTGQNFDIREATHNR